MSLEEKIAKLLISKKLTLSVAESCTGGLVSDRLTNIPGSSKYFKAGFIVYSNEAKIKLLKIPAGILEKYGAVSEQTTLLLAKNASKITNSDIGLGVTGIAGPSGGSKTKPVGIVFIAVCFNPDFAIAKSARRVDRLNPIGFNLGRRGNPKQISNAKFGIKNKIICEKFKFSGSRLKIKQQSADKALRLLQRCLIR